MASFPGQSGTGLPLPNLPQNLAVTGTTTSSVSLSWNAPVGGATSYNLYRNGLRVQTGISGTSTTDTGLTPSTAYTYYVTSVNAIGEGWRSNQIVGTTGAVPNAPQSLAVTGTTNSSVSLSWSAPPGGATTYNLYRNGVRVWVGISGTSQTDTGLSPSTSYNYYVTGVNSFGEGPQSNQVVGTTSSQQSIKWNPGLGMASDQQPMGPSDTVNPSTGAGKFGNELNNLTPWSNLRLYRIWLTWSAIEPTTQGVYAFTQLLNLLDFCHSNGLHLIIQFNPNRFNGGALGPSRSTDNSILPAYIINNVGTFGAGLLSNGASPPSQIPDPNGLSGYYSQSSAGYCANLSNANVTNALYAALTALAAAIDTHPALEAIGLCENSNMEPVTVFGISSGHEARWLALAQKMKQVFTHTNVYAQASFTNNGIPGQYSQVDAMYQSQILMGNADAFPASHYAPSNNKPTTGASWGVQAWCGVANTGTTPKDYRPLSRAIMDSQENEVINAGGTIQDFIAGYNLLGCSHAVYTYTGIAHQAQNNWVNAAPLLNSLAGTLVNTGYPPNYTS